jgi:uncharacterized protein (DUF2141 family)
MKNNIIPLSALICSLVLLLPATALAALNGNYHGDLQGEVVTATFEDQAGGVSGTLTIGATQYILQAEKTGAGYQGTLINLSKGYGATLRIQEQEGKLKLDIETEGKPAQQLELQPDG